MLGLSIKGDHTENGWLRFLNGITTALGMHPVGVPMIWRYPVEGKGGNGATMVQAITDSFLALDTWPDHDGCYLFINSCKLFAHDDVLNFITMQGFHITDSFSGTLRIPDGQVRQQDSLHS